MTNFVILSEIFYDIEAIIVNKKFVKKFNRIYSIVFLLFILLSFDWFDR